MKDLNKETVTTIVNALITVRLEGAMSLQEAARLGQPTYQAQIQQELDENAAALRELSEDVAPWLQYHSQLRDVFPETVTPKTEQQRKQLAQEKS